MTSSETQDTPSPVTLEQLQTAMADVADAFDSAAWHYASNPSYARFCEQAQAELLKEAYRQLRETGLEPTRVNFDRTRAEHTDRELVLASLEHRILRLGGLASMLTALDRAARSFSRRPGYAEVWEEALMRLQQQWRKKLLEVEAEPTRDSFNALVAQRSSQQFAFTSMLNRCTTLLRQRAEHAKKVEDGEGDKRGGPTDAFETATGYEIQEGYFPPEDLEQSYSTLTGGPDYTTSAENAYLRKADRDHRADIVRGLWSLLLERGSRTPAPATSWTARQVEMLIVRADLRQDGITETGTQTAARLGVNKATVSRDQTAAFAAFRACLYTAAVLAPPEATLADHDHVNACLDMLDRLGPDPVLDPDEADLLRIAAQAVRRIRGHGQRVHIPLFTALKPAQNFLLRADEHRPDASDGQLLTEMTDLVDELHNVETKFATAIAPQGAPLTFNCVAEDPAHRGDIPDRDMEINFPVRRPTEI